MHQSLSIGQGMSDKFRTDENELSMNDALYYSLQRTLLDQSMNIHNDGSLQSQNFKVVAKYYIEELPQNYKQLLKCKELSIVTPQLISERIDDGRKVVWMIFDNLDPYDFMQLPEKQKILDLIQLIFSLKALSEQNWNLMLQEKLFCQRDGRVYISLMKYSFRLCKLDECVKQFQIIAKKILPDKLQDLNFGTYQAMANYLISLIKEDIQHNDKFEAPYLWLLRKIIQTDKKMESNYTGNSFIYHIEAPQSLKYKRVYDDVNDITIKSTKIPQPNDEEYNRTLQNINREIMFFEEFRDEQCMMQCWFYIRIIDQTFIVMDTNEDLHQYLETKRQQHKLTYELFLQIAYNFAKALNVMHKRKVIHRDLKESNLFVRTYDKNKIHLLIGDFDRSKGSTSPSIYQTIDNSMTTGHNPPEVMENNKHTPESDVWQFGIIIYKIACPKFMIHEFTFDNFLKLQPGARDPFENLERDLQAVNFQGKGIHQDIIKLVRQCVSREGKDRPSSEMLSEYFKRNYYGSVKNIKLKESPMK